MPVSNKLHNVWCEVDCLMSLSNVSAMKFKENSANNSSIAGISSHYQSGALNT